MNAVSNAPLPGLAPGLPPQPAIAVALPEHKRGLRMLKDILISIYAYGLLLVGICTPFVLAAWHKFFVAVTP